MRILFITSNRLGDAVLSTGLLAHLIERHPGARITVVTGGVPAPLFRPMPGVEEVIALTKQPLAMHWTGLWRRVGLTRWDVLVDLRAVPLMRLVPARARHVWRRAAPGTHKVIENAAVMGLDPPPEPRLWLPEAARGSAARLLPEGRPWLALAPTAGTPRKEWPADRFVALTRKLTGEGGPLAGAGVLVTGGPGEETRAGATISPLRAAGIETVDFVGKGDALAAAAAIARCRLFVGNDSGLMHIAAALGVPTLGIFGMGQPAVYRPWGGVHLYRAQEADENGSVVGVAADAALDAARALLAPAPALRPRPGRIMQ